MCYTTQIVRSCGHRGSSSFSCPKGFTLRECPSQYIKQVCNVKECVPCQLSRQTVRVEEVFEMRDVDELSRMFWRKIRTTELVREKS
jgi:hypothetical protein